MTKPQTSPRFSVLHTALAAGAAALALLPGCTNTTVPDGCPETQIMCEGLCINPSQNPAHCGKCGNACEGEEVCSLAQCGMECTGGTELCDGLCVNLDGDAQNCGSCGNLCEGGEVCSASTCAMNCTGGTSLCNGRCVNLNTDPAHCGACPNACDSIEVCSGGSCSTSCDADEEQCGASCVVLQTDPAHCGECDNACASGEACVGGECGLFCPSEETRCGANCADLATDADHCGACDNACGADMECIDSVCRPACTGDEVLCTDLCTVLATDPLHCGACDTPCTLGQACVSDNCVLQDFATTSVTPAFTFTPGGLELTVQGAGLDSSVTVTVGGEPCLSPTPVAGGKSLTCVAPPHAAGTFDVVVARGGDETTLPGAFTYRAFTRVDTVAGTGTAGNAVGAGNLAQFSASVNGFALLGDTLYVADGLNFQIRTIDLSGLDLDDVDPSDVSVAVLAGTGTQGSDDSTDGTGATASFRQPMALAPSAGSMLYVADTSWQGSSTLIASVRGVDPLTGATQTLADSGNGYSDLVFDGERYAYLSECSNNFYRLNRLDTTDGTVEPWVAGMGAGVADVPGTGNDSSLVCPFGLALDHEGAKLYGTTLGGQHVLRVDIASTELSFVAGATPSSAGHADDTGTDAKFSLPTRVSGAPNHLFVGERGNCTIRSMDLSTLEVSTVAGVPEECTPNDESDLAAAHFAQISGVYYSPRFGIFVGTGTTGFGATDADGNIRLIH